MMAQRGWWGLTLGALLVAGCADDEASTSSGGAGGTSGTTSTTTNAASASASTGSTGSTGSTTSAGTGGQGGAGQGGASSSGAGGAGGAPSGPTYASCFANAYVNPITDGPDYDQYGPVVASHCLGTNHQDITGVERVVFVGDSVTAGTPPTLASDVFRAELAEALKTKFGLSGAGPLWDQYNVLSQGVGVQKFDGSFANCSKWGARVDDLNLDNKQLKDCISGGDFNKRTLIVMTMGGNDLAALTKAATDGASMATLQSQADTWVNTMRDAIAWIKEPGRFPNGVFVVFANAYEFTDGTGEVQSCDVSQLAGFDQPVPSPASLRAIVVGVHEGYLQIAVDHQVDMLFLAEEFCGHGYERDNPAAPCYRGPGQAAYFDLTCTHPTPAGHDRLREMFMAVVNE
jgi:lysophospholipase L1-like esterase